jgi:hypothetical protein
MKSSFAIFASLIAAFAASVWTPGESLALSQTCATCVQQQLQFQPQLQFAPSCQTCQPSAQLQFAPMQQLAQYVPQVQQQIVQRQVYVPQVQQQVVQQYVPQVQQQVVQQYVPQVQQQIVSPYGSSAVVGGASTIIQSSPVISRAPLINFSIGRPLFGTGFGTGFGTVIRPGFGTVIQPGFGPVFAPGFQGGFFGRPFLNFNFGRSRGPGRFIIGQGGNVRPAQNAALAGRARPANNAIAASRPKSGAGQVLARAK